MKKIVLFSALLGTTLLMAVPNQVHTDKSTQHKTFETKKDKILKVLDYRINHLGKLISILKESKSCVTQSKKRSDIAKCKKQALLKLKPMVK